jgi:hypothetical protein
LFYGVGWVCGWILGGGVQTVARAGQQVAAVVGEVGVDGHTVMVMALVWRKECSYFYSFLCPYPLAYSPKSIQKQPRNSSFVEV